MKAGAARVLAVDTGASGGRVMAVELSDGVLRLEEVSRFENTPIRRGDSLRWNFAELLSDVRAGLKSGAKAARVDSIGVDTWGVDYGLVDGDGKLIEEPFHYRDSRTRGVMEKVVCAISAQTMFAATGIQFLPFNTVFQLVAHRQHSPETLERAKTFLMMPDLFAYHLTGQIVCEYTNASTTQLLDARSRTWSDLLMSEAGIPRRIFPAIIAAGSRVGTMTDPCCNGIPFIATATHDTGSAVVGVPAETDSFAYLSCGTWSLLGTETREPITSRDALELNFTNEGGYNGTYRLLKNIMGLWILQETRRVWAEDGQKFEWSGLIESATVSEPFRSLIDPDDSRFLEPGDMPARIRGFCDETDQPVPETTGQFVRCILESLALKYSVVLEALSSLTKRRFDVLHLVGGGARNTLLCQFAADACGLPVITGPEEATVLGNAGVQMLGLGVLKDIQTFRKAVATSFASARYQPGNSNSWNAQNPRFRQLAVATPQIT